jgi:hypothetical protein
VNIVGHQQHLGFDDLFYQIWLIFEVFLQLERQIQMPFKVERILRIAKTVTLYNGQLDFLVITRFDKREIIL